MIFNGPSGVEGSTCTTPRRLHRTDLLPFRKQPYSSMSDGGNRTQLVLETYGKLSHDEGDISTPFLPLSFDVSYTVTSTWLYLLYLLRHVTVNTSLALPYRGGSRSEKGGSNIFDVW